MIDWVNTLVVSRTELFPNWFRLLRKNILQSLSKHASHCLAYVFGFPILSNGLAESFGNFLSFSLLPVDTCITLSGLCFGFPIFFYSNCGRLKTSFIIFCVFIVLFVSFLTFTVFYFTLVSKYVHYSIDYIIMHVRSTSKQYISCFVFGW